MVHPRVDCTVVLAPNITICSGDVRFQWTIFSEAAAVFSQYVDCSCCPLQIQKLARSVQVFGIVTRLDALREVCHSRQWVDPFVFLCQFLGKTATLDHDLLYGFFGMIDFDGRLDQSPPYDLSVRDVYTDFTRWYLQAQNNCECAVFIALTLASVKSRYADLPSWVVDLTIFEEASNLHVAFTTSAQILWVMKNSELYIYPRNWNVARE